MTPRNRVMAMRSVISKRWVTLTALLLVGMGLLLIGAALVSRLTAQIVKNGDTVIVHYTLKLDNQSVYFSTEESEPAQYSLGEGQLLPALEEAIVGMHIGDKKTIRLTAEQAYGPYRPELVMRISRSELPQDSQPVLGQQLLTESETGTPLVLVITAVTEVMVTLDANHPLSGKNLTFEIEVVGIERGAKTGGRSY